MSRPQWTPVRHGRPSTLALRLFTSSSQDRLKADDPALCLLPIAALLASRGSSKPTPDPRVEVLERSPAEHSRRIDTLEAARQRAVMDAGRKPPNLVG